MFCTRCGIEIDEKVRYCSACGHPTKLAEAAANPYASPRLALDTENKKIAGVCAGFARYLGVDALLIRIVWLALALGAGYGALMGVFILFVGESLNSVGDFFAGTTVLYDPDNVLLDR